MRYDIDLAGLSGRRELHELLRRTLALPEWYGYNLDALHDVLAEDSEPRELVFRNEGRADDGLRDYFDSLRRMCDALAETLPDFSARWIGESKYLDRAVQVRSDPERHYNCAQGVLVPFAADAGLDEEAAFRLAANFGGGMKRASVCGAITGGLMVLGLFGLEDGAAVAEYHRQLRAKHENCLDCADLLRLNKAQGGDKKTHCDGMVCECVELAERLLRDAGRLPPQD